MAKDKDVDVKEIPMDPDQELREMFFDGNYDETMSFEEFKRRGIAKRSKGSPASGEVAGNLNQSELDLIASMGPMQGNLSIAELIALARAQMLGNLNEEEVKTLRKQNTKKRVRRSKGSPKTGEVAKRSKVRGAGAAIKGTNFKVVF